MIKKALTSSLLCFASLLANDPLNLFSIDATRRGNEIASMITTLTTTAPYQAATSEVAIQTNGLVAFPYAPYVNNGLIPWIKSATSFGTLLLVTYQPPGVLPQYLVVPVEEIAELVYLNPSQQFFAISSGFSSNFASGTLPLLSISPAERAADVQSVVNTLLTTAPYKTSISQVDLLTTLSGPFYPPFQNGQIPNIQSMTLSSGSSLLLVNYKNKSGLIGNIVVTAEQIQHVVYYPSAP